MPFVQSPLCRALAAFSAAALLAACQTTGLGGNSAANAGNPSPTAGGSTSEQANQMADKAMYKPIEYANIDKKGPPIVVIPGEIKSSNATFTQKFGPNNIADYAELELGKANFKVLERGDMGSLLNEFTIAFNLGDPKAAGKILKKGKFKTTKWVVKFDILKAEPVAQANQGFDGQALGNIIASAGGNRDSRAAGAALASVKTEESAGVWVVGMRYKILNANTTEQVATGYAEEKMELGAKGTSILGFKQAAAGGLTLDSLVQRLVQKSVWEIDQKYK